jgi:hypothetical protein
MKNLATFLIDQAPFISFVWGLMKNLATFLIDQAPFVSFI